jgi:hypothetical protein
MANINMVHTEKPVTLTLIQTCLIQSTNVPDFTKKQHYPSILHCTHVYNSVRVSVLLLYYKTIYKWACLWNRTCLWNQIVFYIYKEICLLT